MLIPMNLYQVSNTEESRKSTKKFITNINMRNFDTIIQEKSFKTLNEFYSVDYYNMFSSRIFESVTDCSKEKCLSPTGMCRNDTCKCYFGYANPFQKDETNLCSYQLKSQLLAFILEAFTLIGGNIYLENYYYAAVKGSSIFFILLIFIFELPSRICGMRDCLDLSCNPCICFKTGTFVLCIVFLFIWETVDLLKIMSYKTLDKNQMPLIYYF